mgnify:CR=1 FL=1
MKTHHLYSTAMILAAAAMISAQPLSAQTISGTQTKAVNMTEGKLTVTGTGFLNVEKNAVNLNKEIQSLLEIEILEGGRISGKRALALDPDMEKGVTGELIRLNNAGTMTGTENQAIDLSHMINTSATITNTGAISASQKGAVKLGNNATLINSGLIETTGKRHHRQKLQPRGRRHLHIRPRASAHQLRRRQNHRHETRRHRGRRSRRHQLRPD